MKIVCLVTNDLSHDQRMDRICTTLANAGHEVTLVGRLLPTSPDLPEKPYRQHRIKCRNLAGKMFYAEYNRRLWLRLRNWTYDAICAVDLDTLPAGSLLAYGKPLVYDAHEWFSETPEVVARPLIRVFWQQLGQLLVPRTTVRYTVGPELAVQLQGEFGVEFNVVRNAPLTNMAPAAAPSDLPVTDRKVLLYQGMLNPGRGLVTAIEAVANLPDCELWLVGDGPLLGALRRCSEKLGCAKRVWFAGFRPPKVLPAITQRAWLGLNLLDNVSPSYYYSLANKSLDYPQAGLPSVQMDFPEYRNIAEAYDCYALLPVMKPYALIHQVTRLLENPDRYKELQAGCGRAAAVLNWEAEEKNLLSIWQKLDDGA